MALESLLPSEIARLVYGYLIDEKCLEAANKFFNESPHLEECRSERSYGRNYTTRICGYALQQILDNFCLINSLVQEEIEKSGSSDKLKSIDLVNQIKFFLKESKSERFGNYVNELITITLLQRSQKNSPTTENALPTKLHRKQFYLNQKKKMMVCKALQCPEAIQLVYNINQKKKMMAWKALLPSEATRLVFGYLIDEKCLEAANKFFNGSPDLQACRSELSYGRNFTTRVCGYTLQQILDKFCLINSLVQEEIEKSGSSDKLKDVDLVSQIKFFLKESKSEHFRNNVNEIITITSSQMSQ